MATKVPAYTYSGESSSEMIGNYWYIYLKSSGTLNLSYAKRTVDIFLQGGGGGGATSSGNDGGGGGAGGYQTTRYGIGVESGAQSITVGAGGKANNAGEATSALGYTAGGGAAGSGRDPGTAGTAAGGKGGWYWDGNNQGEGGSNGSNGKLAFGTGSTYYGAGGGGAKAKFGSHQGAGGVTGGGAGGSGNATANTGSGGGGGYDNNAAPGGTGGSGIVILRGTEDDFLPVYFNGTRLQRMFFNGEPVTGFVFGGVRLFARRCVEWLLKHLACRSESRRATLAL